MNDNVNGVVNEAEQLQEWFRRWVPDPYGVLKDIDKFFPPGKEKGRLDPCSFYCSYPRCFEEDLQQGWPMIESALEKVWCWMETHCIIFITKTDYGARYYHQRSNSSSTSCTKSFCAYGM
ncbi:hypothetical protein ACFX16_010995 [Malus domestica]